MESEIQKSVLYLYFRGESSPIQNLAIKKWLETSKNQETFYLWLSEYENEYSQGLFAKAPSLASLKVKYETVCTDPISFKKNHTKLKFAVAASFLCLIIMTILWHNYNSLEIYHTSYGQIQNVKLKDGSEIILNSNSTLKVPKWFNRTVFLEGEAFFKIVKLGKPKNFIVSTIQHNSVEVWGTAFTVFSRDGLDRVALFEGKVQLHVKDKPSHMMYPNDLILVESGKVTQQRFDLASPYLAWKDHSFYFDNSSLNEIIAQANARFGTIIKVNDNNLLNHSLSGSFKARSIDELLSAVGLILNIKFELNDSFYLATKK